MKRQDASLSISLGVSLALHAGLLLLATEQYARRVGEAIRAEAGPAWAYPLALPEPPALDPPPQPPPLETPEREALGAPEADGFATAATAGESLMAAAEGPQDQPWLSLDPIGAGAAGVSSPHPPGRASTPREAVAVLPEPPPSPTPLGVPVERMAASLPPRPRAAPEAAATPAGDGGGAPASDPPAVRDADRPAPPTEPPPAPTVDAMSRTMAPETRTPDRPPLPAPIDAPDAPTDPANPPAPPSPGADESVPEPRKPSPVAADPLPTDESAQQAAAPPTPFTIAAPLPAPARDASALHSASPGDAAPQGSTDSDPFATIGSVDFRAGRTDARLGRAHRITRPRFTLATYSEIFARSRPAVELGLHLDAAGHVVRVEVLRSSGSNDIDQPLVVAAYAWWFEPRTDAAHRGQPEKVRMTIRFH